MNTTPSPSISCCSRRGVVGLRRGDDGLVQDPAVDRQPRARPGLHLVGDRDVGVQVRVAGAGVAVGERRSRSAPRLDLPDAVAPLAGEQRLALEEGQRVGNGGVVGGLDRGPDRGRGDRPQRGHDFTGENVRS